MSHIVTMEDGTRLSLPTPRLSFSQVSMYLKCPMQYYFRYVEGRKEPPGIALVEGSTAHEALEADGIQFVKHGSRLPHKELVQVFGDTFATTRKNVSDWSDKTAPNGVATPNFIQNRASVYLATYAADIAPDYDPIAAEKEHNFTVQGIPFIGYTDFETERGVFDFKVSKSNSPYFRRGSAEGSIQLGLYALCTGKRETTFIGLLKDKPEQYKVASANKTDGDIAYTEAVVAGAARAISAGAFPMCGPDNFLCGPKWCGYWGRCRGKLLGEQPEPKAVVLQGGETQAKSKVNLKGVKAALKRAADNAEAIVEAEAKKRSARKKPVTKRKKKTAVKPPKVGRRKKV
jgi:hypothetical protein